MANLRSKLPPLKVTFRPTAGNVERKLVCRVRSHVAVISIALQGSMIISTMTGAAVAAWQAVQKVALP